MQYKVNVGPSKKDGIFISLIVIALFGGFVLGMRPWETTESPKERLTSLYTKPKVDSIKLYMVQELSENCIVGGFNVDAIPRNIVVCSKEVTADEIKTFHGEEGTKPGFLGKLFDYVPFGLAFGSGETEEERVLIEQSMGRIISYVESRDP